MSVRRRDFGTAATDVLAMVPVMVGDLQVPARAIVIPAENGCC